MVGNIDRSEPRGRPGCPIFRSIEYQLVGQFGPAGHRLAWQITGRLGNLTVDMIQPAEAQANIYTNFLGKHGDGILSIVHEVPSRQALEAEIRRMKGKGVEVLQQVTVERGQAPVTYTYFDTEPEGSSLWAWCTLPVE